MNPQERELLTSFLQQMTQAQAGQKDTEADRLIGAACARQPDAAYLLVQRAIQLEHALQATQSQVTKLQAELEQVRGGTSTGFLDNANTWGRAAPAPIAPAAAAVAAGQPRVQAGPAAPVSGSTWGSGMLGNIATTAAGVVAGSFLFQGIQSLMGHQNTGANLGANAAENTFQPIAENSAPNNDSDGSDTYDATELASADDGDAGDLA
jgi:hypothetical protein